MSKKSNKLPDIAPGEFERLFSQSQKKTPEPGEDFASLLDEYSDIDFDVHLHEKESSPEAQKELFAKPKIKEIDLHGLLKEEAEDLVKSAVRDMFRLNISMLKIITGKGIHSKFGAVLPLAVNDLLAEFKAAHAISKFTWEKSRIEDSGYVYVFR